jgi:hypothetical protein
MFLDEALSNLIALHPCSSHADGIALTILVSRHCVIAADVSGDLGVLSVCLSVSLSCFPNTRVRLFLFLCTQLQARRLLIIASCFLSTLAQEYAFVQMES